MFEIKPICPIFDRNVSNRCNCIAVDVSNSTIIKTDCIHYYTEQNMGAHDPYCELKGTCPYVLPCDNCEHYISVYGKIREI